MEWEDVHVADVQPDPVSGAVIGAAIAVHKALGPGLLEAAYQACMAYELKERGVSYQAQLELPVLYRGQPVACNFRLDFLVEDKLIVELKAVEKLLPIHEAQLLTYLKLSGKRTGLLLNFNTPVLRGGIKRMSL